MKSWEDQTSYLDERPSLSGIMRSSLTVALQVVLDLYKVFYLFGALFSSMEKLDNISIFSGRIFVSYTDESKLNHIRRRNIYYKREYMLILSLTLNSFGVSAWTLSHAIVYGYLGYWSLTHWRKWALISRKKQNPDQVSPVVGFSLTYLENLVTCPVICPS